MKEENVSSIFPSLFIKILWKFHFGTAELPWLVLAHLNNSCALFPFTSEIAESGKVILKLTSQNSLTSEFLFFSWLNEFDGTARTTKPLLLYLSQRIWSSSYWFVNPQ